MKERVTIWLESHQIKSIEKCVEIEDFKNNSQFVGQAVEFYLGYLNTKNSTKFLSNILLGEMEGLVQTTEKRLQRQLNQNKFTLDMVLKLLEYGYELDQDDMQKLADTVRIIISNLMEQEKNFLVNLNEKYLNDFLIQ